MSGCGQRNGANLPAAAEPDVAVSGRELVFVGPITRLSLVRVREALTANALTGITIDSGGGDVESALEIAALVRDHRLDVRVRGACLSSCANYIFPSGQRKFIVRGAIVAWHGSSAHLHYQDTKGIGSSDPVIRQFNANLARKDAEFMQSIGVDPHVSWFGKLPPFNAPNFYALSTTDMESFGIKAVTAPRDYGAGYLDSLPEGLRQGIVFISADAETTQRRLRERVD
jgi:hypothetical protein